MNENLHLDFDHCFLCDGSLISERVNFFIENDEGVKRSIKVCYECYDKVHEALYDLRNLNKFGKSCSR